MDVPTQDYPELLKLLLDTLIKQNCLKKYALFDDNTTGSVLLKVHFTKPKTDPSGEVTHKSWVQRSDKQTQRSDNRFSKHLESKGASLITRSKTKNSDSYQHVELPRDSETENCAHSEQVISPVKCVVDPPSPESLNRDILHTPPVPDSKQPLHRSVDIQASASATVELPKQPNKPAKSPSHSSKTISADRAKLKNIRDNLGKQKTALFPCDFCQMHGPLPYIDCPRTDEQRCYKCYVRDEIMIKHLDCCKNHMIWKGRQNTYPNS